MARTFVRYRVWQRRDGAAPSPGHDDVACEEPLEIRVGGRPISVTMRTPGHDDELAVGFLVGEGVIGRPSDVERVRLCETEAGNMADVLVAPAVLVDVARLTRHVFASSSCGVCGTATIDALRARWPPLGNGVTIGIATLESLAETLHASQTTFHRTGGLHAAGLFDVEGRLLVAREDVGRHNAVDKVIGHAALAGWLPLTQHVLLVSGRASFEIVQKALAARISIVAAVSAPSSLAVDLAEESNLTLVGFLRPGRFTVYAVPRRIS